MFSADWINVSLTARGKVTKTASVNHKVSKKRRAEAEVQRERERENSKTLSYKDCSLGSVKNLTTSPC